MLRLRSCPRHRAACLIFALVGLWGCVRGGVPSDSQRRDGPADGHGFFDGSAGTHDGQGEDGLTITQGQLFGSASNEFGRVVAYGLGGEIFVAGEFAGTTDFGDGARVSASHFDIFVLRLDAQGALIQSKHFGGQNGDYVHGIAVDKRGHIAITGSMGGSVDFGGGAHGNEGYNDIFVVSMDHTLGYRWSRSFGGPGVDQGSAIAADPDGALVVTGYMEGTVDFGPTTLASAGATDVVVFRLEPDGDLHWAKRYGGDAADQGHGAAVARNGDIVVTGGFTAAIDFGGQSLTGAGTVDRFVAVLNRAGHHRWAKRFSDAKYDSPTSVAIDPAGNIAIVGTFTKTMHLGGATLTSVGLMDGFVVSYDGVGQYRWSHRFGGPYSDRANQVVATRDGSFVLVGQVQGLVDLGGGPLAAYGRPDALVAAFGADGRHLWSHAFGASEMDEGSGVAVSGQGEVAAVGATYGGPMHVGEQILESAGRADAFLLRLPLQQ